MAIHALFAYIHVKNADEAMKTPGPKKCSAATRRC